MSKKYIDHNQYYLTIYNVNGKTDTLIFTLWREDFNKVAIGDKIIKEERSLNAFLYKDMCNDTGCAIRLQLP